MSELAYCDIYADDTLILHIDGKCGGCMMLQDPCVIDDIYIACDKNKGKHYIIYPSTVTAPDINVVINAIVNGHTIKSKVTTLSDGYYETIDVNSIDTESIYREIVDNVLIDVQSFVMQKSDLI